MATTKVTKEQFPDLIVALLLDKMFKGEDLLGENEDFNELMKIMEKRSMKPILLHYYMSSDAVVRSKYKTLSKAFVTGKSESAAIYIDAGKKLKKGKEKGKDGIIKGLIKKALKLVASQKKRSGFPLNEDKVDKILDRLLEEEWYSLEDKE